MFITIALAVATGIILAAILLGEGGYFFDLLRRLNSGVYRFIVWVGAALVVCTVGYTAITAAWSAYLVMHPAQFFMPVIVGGALIYFAIRSELNKDKP